MSNLLNTSFCELKYRNTISQTNKLTILYVNTNQEIHVTKSREKVYDLKYA